MRWQTQAIWPWLPGYKHMPLEILAHAHTLASHKMNRHLASNFWKICTFQRVAAHLFHGPRTATAVVVRPDYLHHFEHLAHISTFCGFSLGRFLIQSLSIICSHKFIHENAHTHTHTACTDDYVSLIGTRISELISVEMNSFPSQVMSLVCLSL